MRQFDDLDHVKQCELLVELLRRVSNRSRIERVRTAAELAAREGRSVQEVWADVCSACGIEPCSMPLAVQLEQT
jgi:hypothetical protein